MRENILMLLVASKEGNKMNIKRDPYGFILTMNTINQAISLLQSHGYKVEAPYANPTDEEICERIRHDNEKIGWTADWSDFSCVKCVIYYSNEEKKWFYWELVESEIIGMTYTSIEIAEQIVDELNEGRFVRV